MRRILPTLELAAPTRDDARKRAEELRPGAQIVRVRGLGTRWWVVTYQPRHRRGCVCGQRHGRRTW